MMTHDLLLLLLAVTCFGVCCYCCYRVGGAQVLNRLRNDSMLYILSLLLLPGGTTATADTSRPLLFCIRCRMILLAVSRPLLPGVGSDTAICAAVLLNATKGCSLQLYELSCSLFTEVARRCVPHKSARAPHTIFVLTNPLRLSCGACDDAAHKHGKTLEC